MVFLHAVSFFRKSITLSFLIGFVTFFSQTMASEYEIEVMECDPPLRKPNVFERQSHHLSKNLKDIISAFEPLESYVRQHKLYGKVSRDFETIKAILNGDFIDENQTYKLLHTYQDLLNILGLIQNHGHSHQEKYSYYKSVRNNIRDAILDSVRFFAPDDEGILYQQHKDYTRHVKESLDAFFKNICTMLGANNSEGYTPSTWTNGWKHAEFFPVTGDHKAFILRVSLLRDLNLEKISNILPTLNALEEQLTNAFNSYNKKINEDKASWATYLYIKTGTPAEQNPQSSLESLSKLKESVSEYVTQVSGPHSLYKKSVHLFHKIMRESKVQKLKS